MPESMLDLQRYTFSLNPNALHNSSHAWLVDAAVTDVSQSKAFMESKLQSISFLSEHKNDGLRTVLSI